MRHHTTAHVRWDDLDAFGHVNNAKYLTYAQESRADFTWFSRSSAGLEIVLTDMVVARAEVDFIAPIYQGGFNADIVIWISKISNSSFEMQYEISSHEGLHARVKTVQVTVDMMTKKSRRLNASEIEFLNQYFEA